MTRIAVQRLAQLREDLNHNPVGKDKRLVISFDGGFPNATVFRDLPPNTTYVGRIRKDASLFAPPDPAQAKPKGRRRPYGNPLPTPEQMRKDDAIPWITVRAWAAGKLHEFRIKTVAAVRWRGTGNQTQRLVIIAPLGYRLTQQSRVLYRDPAFLLCTDPDLALEKLLQAFLWRCGIEVDFRDEKTIIGLGEPQVWTENSVALVPAFQAAAYAYLQLAVRAAYGADGLCPLPQPKWQRSRPHPRITTNDAIRLLRAELWGQALGVTHFSDFVHTTRQDAKSEKCHPHLKSAVIYAIR